MRKLIRAGIWISLVMLISCGTPSASDKTPLAEKKNQLLKLKQQQDKLNADILNLQDDIGKEDPSFGVKPKLVSITPLAPQKFTHYIDLQGRITTDNIYNVAPRGPGGQVKEVYVKIGDHVKKGQLVLKLEDAILLQNLTQVQTQLDFAKNMYSRQKNLWDQGIGTEVQLITAKNNVDNAERQISVLKEQWSNSNVYSEVAGVVESVNIHAGEMFTGAASNGISIVNSNSLKVVVDIPENYLTSVKNGTHVIVGVPDVGKQFNSSISLVSQLINNNSRSFMAEAKVPPSSELKPNQVALIKIQDYSAESVIVVPMTSLQTDETGKYVFVSVTEDGKKIARKRTVLVGSVYGEMIEIKRGLQPGDQLVTEGYQGLYDGQLITTS